MCYKSIILPINVSFVNNKFLFTGEKKNVLQKAGLSAIISIVYLCL